MTLVLAARRQIGHALGRAAGGLAWLLRDEFTTDLAAGSVNGTAAEPGPGTRVTVETSGSVAIASGQAAVTGANSYTSPVLYWSGAIDRTPGRLAILSAGNSLGVDNNAFGFTASPTAAWNSSTVKEYWRISTSDFRPNNLITSQIRGTVPVAIILRATGAFFLEKLSTTWTLHWISASDATATLYIGTNIYNSGLTTYCQYVRVPDILWLPTPLASDGFGSTFGTTDGLGHAEGIAGGIGAGGGGVTWSNGGSTWSVSGGKAINTAPSGLSQQISVLSTGTANVFASVALTRSAGNVGLALSIDSASSPANGVLVYLDGTNCKVDKIVSGVTSNVRTTAVTYSAGARLVVAKNGTEYHVYYNNAFIVEATISDAGIINNTLHGMFSTDASNTLDNFTCYATGTGGEYATLDQYIQ